MSDTARIAWFAGQEARLGLRDLVAMLRGGHRGRFTVATVLVACAFMLHLVAWAVIGRHAEAIAGAPDLRTLVMVTGGLALSSCLILSQAIESITRVLYGRGDFELILSSPLSKRLVFAVRIAVVGLSVTATTLFIAAPFANVLAVTHGLRWLCIYPLLFGLGLAMTALGLVVTIGLVRVFGPARTRLAAQIVAAITGAAFAIGLQIAAIAHYGDVSRVAVLASDAVLALVPGRDHPLWLPARAATGDPIAVALVMAACLGVFAVTLVACLDRVARAAAATASVGIAPVARPRVQKTFEAGSAGGALMRKEWRLLARDPWLVSQTLMQVLYLVPPAFMLWQSFGDGAGKLAVLVPVLVMTAGQLAGSLAWLAVSGEDAPDLVATAPVAPIRIVGAKLLAVLAAIGAVLVPFGAALALFSAWIGLVVFGGGLVAGLSAFAIQYWFRQQGRRSQFRRRQTASRLATFAEAFSSILWAATAALAAAETWIAIPVGLLALANLLGAWALSPKA